MRWIRSLMRSLWNRTPKEVPNRVRVRELKQPFPALPELRRLRGVFVRVYLLQTDPARPVLPMTRADGLPRLNDEWTGSLPLALARPGMRLVVASVEVVAAPDAGNAFAVVWYDWLKIVPPQGGSGTAPPTQTPSPARE